MKVFLRDRQQKCRENCRVDELVLEGLRKPKLGQVNPASRWISLDEIRKEGSYKPDSNDGICQNVYPDEWPDFSLPGRLKPRNSRPIAKVADRPTRWCRIVYLYQLGRRPDCCNHIQKLS